MILKILSILLSQNKNELVKEPVKSQEETSQTPEIEPSYAITDIKADIQNEPVNGLVNEMINLKEDELKILRLIIRNSHITQDEIADMLYLSKSSIKRDMESLKEKGWIARIGADKNGYWKVLK